MRTFKKLASLMLFFNVSAAAAPMQEAPRPIDARDVANYEKIIDTLESGGKICQTQMELLGGSHLMRRPCVEGRQLTEEEWGRVYENLRMLKACVAAAKPCMPRPKPKDNKPRTKRDIRVYSNY